ncbi:MAG: hypothetical protein COU33_04920, partial [Candidatus Magasanikbacteria bacterium CG10_big_fil_rev_8_21_14_0_10_43_6]
AKEMEDSRLDDISFYQIYDITDIATSIAQTVHLMAENDQIHLIVTSASYGHITERINSFRPNVPIMVAAANAHVARQLMLRSGVVPIVMDDAPGSFVLRMERKLRSMKMIQKGMRVAYITASPLGDIQLTVK